jgi:hypothetical protein
VEAGLWAGHFLRVGRANAAEAFEIDPAFDPP